MSDLQAKYAPTPWRIEHDDQCGQVIVAANGWPVYKWPNYITKDAAARWPDDPCGQFNNDGCCLTEDAMEVIVNAVNASRSPLDKWPSDQLERDMLADTIDPAMTEREQDLSCHVKSLLDRVRQLELRLASRMVARSYEPDATDENDPFLYGQQDAIDD